jgi:hypothetical protein
MRAFRQLAAGLGLAYLAIIHLLIAGQVTSSNSE